MPIILFFLSSFSSVMYFSSWSWSWVRKILTLKSPWLTFRRTLPHFHVDKDAIDPVCCVVLSTSYPPDKSLLKWWHFPFPVDWIMDTVPLHLQLGFISCFKINSITPPKKLVSWYQENRLCGIFILLPGENGEAAVIHVYEELVVQIAGETLPDYDLPGGPEWFVIGDLDVGGQLGEAPGGVLQGGRHYITGLYPLLGRQRTSDDHWVVVDVFVAEMWNVSLRECYRWPRVVSPVVNNLGLPVLQNGLRPLYRHRHCQPPLNWGSVKDWSATNFH